MQAWGMGWQIPAARQCQWTFMGMLGFDRNAGRHKSGRELPALLRSHGRVEWGLFGGGGGGFGWGV
jgi:hypothetical protein